MTPPFREDEIHGGTGPTLAGADGTPAPVVQEQGRWSAADMDAGRPLAAQRRRLAAKAGSGQRAQAATPQAEAEHAPYLFDFEKKPAKLLSFVSVCAWLPTVMRPPPPDRPAVAALCRRLARAHPAATTTRLHSHF